ncbi:MAG: hypothetical protein KJS97_01590 [Alphaproteobacteria bacterium]|nr:hypothetical protein [Alphaproteobacteria bacterium]
MRALLFQLHMAAAALDVVARAAPDALQGPLVAAARTAFACLDSLDAGGEAVAAASEALRRARHDLEALATSDAPVTPDALDAALARMHAAGAVFRAAVAARDAPT